MKVTLNWLKQYVDFDWSPEELAERLTMLGIEVEGIQKIGGAFEGVVVALVITRDKHPNADKLSLCRVNDGRGERQIVCGAQNFQAGDKVPLVLPGATLPAFGTEPPMTIKVGKIRGVESQGMLCSPKELGLAEDASGLMILPAEAKVGQPFADYLGRTGSDVVYDLEITPNRPDLNSVIGIARDISALTGAPLRMPQINITEGSDSVAGNVDVRIEEPELCPRYTARLIKGVRIGPSPDWLRTSLEKVGIRSINNVVDVTNFVMLEYGQPLHAFDYHLLQKSPGAGMPCIVVRNAGEGEKFTTLDGQERALTARNLLIADEMRAVALAGVMGGLNSEINDSTKDVLIESAYFKPQNIRATSKKLELRTESSYRFERGGDVEICETASRRAAQLILQTAGGSLCSGVVDSYPKPYAPKCIRFRYTHTDAILGIGIPIEQQLDYLGRLGLEVDDPAGVAPFTGVRTPHTITCRVPSFRVDLKREIDLVEEVARLYGVDRIPSTPPRGAIGANSYDAVYDQHSEARRIMAGLGFREAQGQTLISLASAQLAVAENIVPLANPLSSDMNVLRPSLLPGLLDACRHNLNHKNMNVALFEVGRVFRDNQGKVIEKRSLATALTGSRYPLFWSGQDRDVKCDIFDLKGVIEEFLEQFGLRGFSFQREAEPGAPFLESATVHLGRLLIGRIGLLQPLIARKYDVRDPALLAELDLDELTARRNPGKSFKALPAFPSVRRDIAMIVPESVTHEAILQTVKETRTANLETVELFDVFRGKNVAEGQKSLAYALTYRSPERTLTDNEVNSAHGKVVEQLRAKLAATIRDQ